LLHMWIDVKRWRWSEVLNLSPTRNLNAVVRTRVTIT
jgi:hypothetical protein